MNLHAISPFANYLLSFLTDDALHAPLEVWLAIFVATFCYWFLFTIPSVVTIGFFDRKLGADVHMRLGPNRTGPYGLLQPFADFVKLFFKEEILFSKTSAPSFFLRWCPVFAVFSQFLCLSAIPLAHDWVLSDLEAGVIFVSAMFVLSHTSLFWAGFASTEEFAFINGFRCLALSTAYFLPLFLSLLSPILIAGTTNFTEIVIFQGGLPWRWNVIRNPGSFISFIAFSLTVLIWQGRSPFDFLRATGNVSDHLAGQYSGTLRALFSFHSHFSLFLASGLLVTVFLGGWAIPFNLEFFGRAASLLECLYFFVKTSFVALLFIWIRWSLPRLEMGQVFHFSWKFLTLGSALGLFLTAAWLMV